MDSAAIGRWGGAEFMARPEGVGVEKAWALAEKIRAALVAIPYETASPQTVSIGVIQAKATESIRP